MDQHQQRIERCVYCQGFTEIQGNRLGRFSKYKISTRAAFVREGLFAWQRVYPDLNRYLLICRVLILDSRVERGMPSFAAAPPGPDTRPRLSVNADSIISFS